MKKFGIWLTTFFLLTSILFVTYAASDIPNDKERNGNYEEAYFVLRETGVLDEVDLDMQNPSAVITNIQFSKMIRNASCGVDIYNATNQLTTDITYDQAVKMMVTALGYGAIARTQGGFPLGYKLVAANNGIFKNISVKGADVATQENLIIMLYNALSVDVMETVDLSANSAQTQIIKGKTLLTSIKKLKKIKIINGLVMETPVSSLVGMTKLSANQVDIDGVVYQTEHNVQVTNLLGRYVLAFAMGDEADTHNTIYAIYHKAKKNREFRLSTSDIISYSNYKYTYYNENKKETALNIPKDILIVYNGVGLSSVVSEDLAVLNGSLTLLDNDNNGSYDILFIDEYQNYLVKSVDMANETITFKADRFQPRRTLSIKSNENDYTYFVVNYKEEPYNAKAYDPSDLKNLNINDVVSLFESKDKKVITLAITNTVVKGTLNEIAYEEGEATIDNTLYKLAKYSDEEYLAPVADFKLGDEETFYFNIYHEIVCVDPLNTGVGVPLVTSSSKGYAYVLDYRLSNNLPKTLSVKLLRGNVLRDPVVDETENNDLSKVDEKTVEVVKKVVYGQKIEVGICADRITLNDAKVTAEELLNYLQKGSVIGFQTNSAGQITTINSFVKDEKERKFSNEYNTFSDMTPNGAFKVSKETQFIVVPTAATTDDDYDVRYTLSDAGLYKISPYDLTKSFNSDMEIANVAVIKVNITGHRAGLVTDNAPISVVDKVVMALNEYGDVTTKVYAYTSGIYKGYLMRVPYKGEFVPQPPQKGTVVKLSIDGDGNIDNYVILADLNNRQLPFFRMGARTRNERVFGLVYDKRNDILQDLTGKIVDQIDVTYLTEYTETDIRTYDINNVLLKQIYLYDRSSGKVSLATMDDIYTYITSAESASKVFLYISLEDVRGLVVVKD